MIEADLNTQCNLFFINNNRNRNIMGCQQSQIKQKQNTILEKAEVSLQTPEKKIIRPQKKKGRVSLNKTFQNIRKLGTPQTPGDLELIQSIISKHFLLFKLSKNQRRALASAMEAYQTDINQYVFQQGNPASMFFIINSGEVQIQINNTSVRTMKRGDSFGELAIIYTSPRSASVKVLQKASFWCLSQHQFLKIQREMVKNNFKISQPYVNRLPLFQYLTDKQKISISYNMNTLKYCENQIIFKANDDAISFFIIIEGVIEITISGKSPIRLKSGDSFGENCLTLNQKRSGTAKCKQKSELLAISRQDLKSCICVKSQLQLLFHNMIKWVLRRSTIFGSLTNSEQHQFISSGQILLKKDEQVLIAKGQNDDSIYISLEQKINEYSAGQIINEGETIEEQSQFQTRQSLIKHGDGHIFIIKLKKVYPILHKERKKLNKIPLKIDDDKKSQEQTLQTLKSRLVIDFKDLFILRNLGEGEMGKVLLVENKRTLKKYALKCVSKNIVIKNELQKFFKWQKQILDMCDFPLIVKLVHSFKDNYFLYFLMEYIDGGDFYDFLSEIGTCSGTSARFYFGCLLLCIEYLHKNNIIYRDIKPYNAAIDSKGYLHMIDMGTAKLLNSSEQTGFRTFTIIGTPHYMAPEVMQAKGYSFSADIWSLGIILYQMVCGKLPFGNTSDDPSIIYQQIQKNEINFPKNYTDPSGKQLIKRLLQKHPDQRAVQDFSQIKNMEYFFKFNWKELQSQKMTAPSFNPKHIEPKSKQRHPYLLRYLKDQKAKMETPLVSSHCGWDDLF